MREDSWPWRTESAPLLQTQNIRQKNVTEFLLLSDCVIYLFWICNHFSRQTTLEPGIDVPGHLFILEKKFQPRYAYFNHLVYLNLKHSPSTPLITDTFLGKIIKKLKISSLSTTCTTFLLCFILFYTPTLLRPP